MSNLSNNSKKIIVISPYKIYNNNLLFNLWIHTFYNLEKYDSNLDVDYYIYKYIYDNTKKDIYGYDNEIINNTVNYIKNPIYDIIIFVFCEWSGCKNKFLYGENTILINLIESKKKVIIVNSDYFDIKHHKYLRNVIRNNNYFYVMDCSPYYRVVNTYNIPHNRFLQASHHCSDLFNKVEFNENPIMKIYSPGNLSPDYYPERYYFINNIYPKYPELIDINSNHPGQVPLNSDKTGLNYINKINNYFACFTTSVMKQQVILNKHLEIPYVGSLMLAYSSEKKILEEYGFIDKIHYLSCDESNYDEIINYIFDENNRKELDIIRRNGMKLAREKYSHNSVAKNIIENIIK